MYDIFGLVVDERISFTIKKKTAKNRAMQAAISAMRVLGGNDFFSGGTAGSMI